MYTTGSVDGHDGTGGLVGWLQGSAKVIASYSTASVYGRGGGSQSFFGGLAGRLTGGTVTASYATGSVAGEGSHLLIRGLFGVAHADSGNTVTQTNNYFDSNTTGRPGGHTTSALQTPTAYGLTTDTPPSIYANWNVDVEVDGNSDADDPWDFGTASQYPRLKYGGLDPAAQLATVTSMTITSSAGNDTEYHAGDAITLRLTFSQDVDPGAGAGVPLTIGANTRNATPAADAAGRSIDFSYTVTDADVDTDGIAVAAAATLAGAFGRSSVNYALPDTLAAAQTDHRVNVNTVDYDGDNDGLIDISNPAQLNAMRWDLDGNGNPDAGVSAANAAAYGAAFPKRERHQGCSDAGGTASPLHGLRAADQPEL